MSFLNELCAKRNSLKPTTTTITHLDGRKFEESGDTGSTEVPKAQFGFVIDTKPDNVPAKIIDQIFLGSQDCCDLEVLHTYQISSVLSVGVEPPVRRERIVYKFMPCLDCPETDLRDTLTESVCFIEEEIKKGCNVLVHCNAGVSRAACVVIGYLILRHSFSYDEAYAVVKKARSCARPNDGFVKQLKMLRRE